MPEPSANAKATGLAKTPQTAIEREGNQTMNRAQRRAARKPPRPGRRKPLGVNPIAVAISAAQFRERFTSLKQCADEACATSDDAELICVTVGRLVFIVLAAMDGIGLHVEEIEVIKTIMQMADTLGDVNESHSITPERRELLMTGMDYMLAIVDSGELPDKVLGAVWGKLEILLDSSDLGTAAIEQMLKRVSAQTI